MRCAGEGGLLPTPTTPSKNKQGKQATRQELNIRPAAEDKGQQQISQSAPLMDAVYVLIYTD